MKFSIHPSIKRKTLRSSNDKFDFQFAVKWTQNKINVNERIKSLNYFFNDVNIDQETISSNGLHN